MRDGGAVVSGGGNEPLRGEKYWFALAWTMIGLVFVAGAMEIWKVFQ